MEYLIVCSSPRTGSSWLCSLMREAGLITGGREFFEPGLVMPQRVLPKLGLTIDDVLADFDGYVERLKIHWGVPGRNFCVKLHWRDFSTKFTKKLDLDRHFPGARYLSCRRQDHVLQAISNYRARATGGWAHGAATRPDPPYDFEEIGKEIDALTAYDAAWDAYFLQKGIEPFRTTYEELEADYRQVIRSIAAWMGMPIGWFAAWRLRSPMKKQRDEITAQWRARFESERAERG